MTRKTIKLAILSAIVVFIGLLAVISAHLMMVGELSWPPFQHPRAPRSSTAEALGACYSGILYFRNKIGRYPNDLKEVKDLYGIKNSNDPRLKSYRDGWKRPLKYVVENPKLNVGKFDLYSVGKNGIDEYEKPDFGDDFHVRPDGSIRWPPQKR